jgi:CubicO group peptidase (beta-lactamase class C family)
VVDVDALASRIESVVRAGRVPGIAAAVALPDGTFWQRGFGVVDLSTGTAAGPATAYLWFSMTKIVTATAVMQLAGDGVLDLDCPVTDCYPPFSVVTQTRPVTIRHLLSHSSGLANPIPVRWVRAASVPPVDVTAFVTRLLARHRRLRSEPGTAARYSNLGYLVLGEVVAALAGTTFTDHIHRRILSPLRMSHTGFSYSDAAEQPPAVGYQPLPVALTPILRAVLPSGIVAGRHGRYVAYHPFYVLGPAYGGLVGGVTDAIRVARLHLDNGVVDGVQLLTPGAAVHMRDLTLRGGPLDIGLGWYRPSGQRGFVEHLGGGSGFWNVMRLYPDAGTGIVLMGNATRYDHETILAGLTDDTR